MSETMQTATEQLIARERRGIDAYRRDIRFRNIVQSIVSHELNSYGPIDPDQSPRAAHDIAVAVAATLLQTIYEEDAELREQKAMAERYRKLAEDALAFKPMAPFLLRGSAEAEADQQITGKR